MFGITGIRVIRNRTPTSVLVWNREDGQRFVVKAGAEVSCNTWIPWADYVESFKRYHRIDIGLPGDILIPTLDRFLIWMWQRGDAVRFSTDGAWHFPGEPVPGASQVDGDRALIVGASASGAMTIELQK